MCVCVWLLNHVMQQEQTLHKSINKSGKVTGNNWKFFECDLQNNSEKSGT